jgi:hypothetical protein
MMGEIESFSREENARNDMMGEIRWGPRDAVVPCIDLNDGSMHYAIESFPNFNIRAADWPKI